MVETWVTGEAAARERQSQKGVFPCADGIKIREKDSGMVGSWSRTAWDARGKLRDSITELRSLAQSCEDVGLSIAESLYHIAEKIYYADDELNQAIGQAMELLADKENQENQ